MMQSASDASACQNNFKFADFVDCIYPIELEIKDPTDTTWLAPRN